MYNMNINNINDYYYEFSATFFIFVHIQIKQ